MSHRSDVRRHRRAWAGARIAIGALCVALAAGGLAVATHDKTDDPPQQPTAADRSPERASRGETRTSPTATPTPTTPAQKATPRAASPTPPTRTEAPRTTPPAGCASYEGNRRIACGLLPSFGFATSQMPALDELWEHESNWNHLAENPSSGAFGIPQALPADKMASAGSDWRTNPATQIRWGLGYIKDRYGTPTEAWEFWQANNWY